jgi:hypothetical protein
MERWVHQQHIRDAVGHSGHDEVRFVAPVIAASMHALPLAMPLDRNGTLVIEIEGEAGGVWTVTSYREHWSLRMGRAGSADCVLSVPADIWWRIVTLGMPPAEAEARARVDGDSGLAGAALRAVAIIA